MIFLVMSRMKRNSRLAFAILICVILLSMLSGCLLQWESLLVDGLERTYLIHVPLDYDGTNPVPLVLVFHGGGGNGKNAQEMTGFNDKADEEGFIVVYPQGMGRFDNYLLTWNAGFCCGYAYENQIDDVRFIRELIVHIQDQYTINESRIYATGLSNGGLMTYRLGAELSEIFAGIAPVTASIGGQATEGGEIWCIPHPSNPVSVIVFHGTNDTRIPYDGGTPTDNDTKGAYSYLSVNESITFWIKANCCDELPKRNISESGKIICDIYSNGMNNTEVVLYTLIDGGHMWPGGEQIRNDSDSPTSEISATEIIWSFFEDHPKQ